MYINYFKNQKCCRKLLGKFIYIKNAKTRREKFINFYTIKLYSYFFQFAATAHKKIHITFFIFYIYFVHIINYKKNKYVLLPQIFIKSNKIYIHIILSSYFIHNNIYINICISVHNYIVFLLINIKKTIIYFAATKIIFAATK
jgi:hypothetical protein